MDNFAVHLSTTDTKKKLSIGQDIIDYLGQPENPTDCEDLGGFIDALVPWMQSSNFKVWKNWNNFLFKKIENIQVSKFMYFPTLETETEKPADTFFDVHVIHCLRLSLH